MYKEHFHGTTSQTTTVGHIRSCAVLFSFRSAKEAEEKIKKALEKGEVLPTEARFDSNCITPGSSCSFHPIKTT